jgi:ribonuclease HI
MSTDVTCADCGVSFQPEPSLLERFPGWTPRQCSSCYRASRRSSAGAAASRSSAGSRSSATSRSSTPSSASAGGSRGALAHAKEELLTVAEVLARYHAGPDTGVFTDGSAIPNPGPGGWGAVYVRDGEVLAQDHGYEPQTTNNRMELRALQAALELVPVGTAATIHTDSNLAVRTLTEWADGWERRGWKRKTGPIQNLDLIQPLHAALRERPELELVWIKAHAGNRWNEYADALATAWARDEL